MIGMDGKRLAREMATSSGRDLSDDETEAIDRAAGEAFDRLNRVPKPLPGAQSLLRDLGERLDLRIPWVIATSSRAEQVRASVAALELPTAPTIVDGSPGASGPSRRRICCCLPRSDSERRPASAGRSAIRRGTSGRPARRAWPAIAVTVGSAVGGDALREAGASLVFGTLDDLRATLERAGVA